MTEAGPSQMTVTATATARFPHSLSPKTDIQSFQFKKLPLEIRLKIYQFAIPARLVTILAYQCMITGGDTEFGAIIERLFTNPTPIAPLLHVNSETRSFVLAKNFRNIESNRATDFDIRRMFLRRYIDDVERYGRRSPPVFYNIRRAVPVESRRYALVDTENYIFFLGDPEISGLGPGPDLILSTIDAMARWMDRYCLDHIKRLAMPYYTWANALKDLSVYRLTEFKALDELFIIFACCEVKPLMDYLHGMPNYVNPVSENVGPQVMDDFEALSTGFPGWKKPTIRFLENKTTLLKELGM